MSIASSLECVWPLGCTLGEGPIWDSTLGAVWFVDIKKQEIHRYTDQNGRTESWSSPQQCGFLAPTAKGKFVAGLKSGLHVFDPSIGSFEPLLEVEPEKPDNRLNDGYVDSQGRLWFGTMDDLESEPSGSLYQLTEAGLRMGDTGYVITNGPAVSPDGKTLYHVDTLEQKIYAFDLAEDGSLTEKRLFAQVQTEGGYADGPVVDAEGCVWQSLFNGWGIERFAPDGAFIERIDLPVPNVTKLAFGGADLKTVYATTAAKGMSDAQLKDAPLSGGLFRFRSSVPGLPQNTVTVGV